MHKQYYKDIDDYIESCGIRVGVIKAADNNCDIYEQLRIMKEFHDRTRGFSGIMDNRIPNLTGRKIEQYKISLKKLTRDIKRFKEEDCKSEFQKILLSVADDYKAKAEECIRKVYDNNYYNIIERSMKRLEMCAGNTYFDNLYFYEGKVTVASTKKCGYNMVEYDLIYLLNKLKRKNTEVEVKDIAEEFCSLEGLEKSSVNFICTLVDYPYEFMKCCNNYRNNRKDLSEEEYTDRLQKIIKKE